MDYFHYRAGALYAEGVAVSELAKNFGTPLYVYSRAAVENAWRVLDQAFGDRPHLVCYAVKANANLAILNLLARLGSGFDIVSGGELERVLRAGGEPAKIVFSGVGKSYAEIERALEIGVRCFNVESAAELDRLQQVAAAHGVPAPLSLRVNPDVDAKTHPYISTGLRENKFGVAMQTALALYRKAADSAHLRIQGIDCHIGSQITQLAPFVDALQRIIALVENLRDAGINIKHLDVGGGLGIRYRDETPPAPNAWINCILQTVGDLPYEIQIEPGRAIVGNAGILVTRVEYLKQNVDKNFAVVDAAMNDLLRPALYGAWQNIVPVAPREGEACHYDIVGPVCETADFLGKERALVLQQGDLLAIRSAGAYAFSMSSNYNARPRAAEVMVDDQQAHLVRTRETFEMLIAGEQQLPD